MKRLFLVLLLIAAATGGIFAYGRWRAGEKDAAAKKIETIAVDEGPVELVLKETGVVEPRQTVQVKSKVSGRVRTVEVAEGDHVKAGQLLAVVEPDATASLTLSQKRMELRRLRIDLEQKGRDAERQRKLAAQGLAPAQAAESAESAYLSAETSYREEKTALNLLEREANQPETRDVSVSGPVADAITDYRIVSPIDGIVASVKVKPGELATSGTTGFSQEGALLMEVADQSELEVVVKVNEIDIPKVKPGMKARVKLAARPESPIEGKVARVAVAPITDENKLIVFPVSIALPERPAELRQGMSASVDLTLLTVASALRIPVLAFLEKDEKAIVKRQSSPGTFEEREIKLGIKGDKQVEVRSGLAKGDVVMARYPRQDEAGPPKS